MSVEQIDVVVPSNPVDLAAITREFDNISNSLVRISGERDFIKETIVALAEKYDLPKKYLSKMAKIHHKQSIDAVEHENDALISAYRQITGKTA